MRTLKRAVRPSTRCLGERIGDGLARLGWCADKRRGGGDVEARLKIGQSRRMTDAWQMRQERCERTDESWRCAAATHERDQVPFGYGSRLWQVLPSAFESHKQNLAQLAGDTRPLRR